MGRQTCRSATHEVDYFETITIVQHSLLPSVARDNFAIQFYRYPVGFHAQQVYQRAQSCGGGRFGFSIDGQVHVIVSFMRLLAWSTACVTILCARGDAASCVSTE
jgi:hypothetical protein